MFVNALSGGRVRIAIGRMGVVWRLVSVKMGVFVKLYQVGVISNAIVWRGMLGGIARKELK